MNRNMLAVIAVAALAAGAANAGDRLPLVSPACQLPETPNCGTLGNVGQYKVGDLPLVQRNGIEHFRKLNGFDDSVTLDTQLVDGVTIRET